MVKYYDMTSITEQVKDRQLELDSMNNNNYMIQDLRISLVSLQVIIV